jgi:hypothetical protein
LESIVTKGARVGFVGRVEVIVAMLFLVASQACGGDPTPPPPAPAASTSPSPAPAASTSPLPAVEGCVPACGAGGRLDPIELPAGDYRTEGFFGGQMTVTFGPGWTSPEDSSGEFAAVPPHAAGAVLFWLDVYPVERFERVEGVPMTADGVISWLRSNPDLDVSAPVGGTIGTLPARIVDVRLADGATNETIADSLAAGLSREDIRFCRRDGRVCSFFLGFPQWSDPQAWGIGVREELQRFYFSNVTYGGTQHLFVSVVYADPAKDQQVMLEAGQRVIDTVQVPADPA